MGGEVGVARDSWWSGDLRSSLPKSLWVCFWDLKWAKQEDGETGRMGSRKKQEGAGARDAHA